MIILQWIWDNIQALMLIGIILRYGKKIYTDLLFAPLAGGNGKVQMDELAKAVILAVFVFSVLVDAFRKTEHHIFTDTYYFALLLSVCAIAAIKPLFDNMKNFKDPDKPAS